MAALVRYRNCHREDPGFSDRTAYSRGLVTLVATLRSHTGGEVLGAPGSVGSSHPQQPLSFSILSQVRQYHAIT